MKAFQRILAVLLCLVMSLGMISMVAFAEETAQTTLGTIDYTKKGSITIHKYEYNGTKGNPATGKDNSNQVPNPDGDENDPKPLEGVTFNVYQIVDADTMKAYLDGTADDDTQAKITNLIKNWKTSYGNYVIKGQTDYTVKNYNLTPVDAAGTDITDNYGLAEFTNLELGLYVVVETNAPPKVTAGEDPFLVALPMTVDNTTWLYDVVVYPKNNTSEGTVTVKKSGEAGALAGVTFTLEKQNGDAWVDADNGTTTLTTYTTNADGEIKFTELAHGTYRLIETGTAEHYIQDGRPVIFTVNTDNTITCNDDRATVTTSGTGKALTINIVNEKPDITKDVTTDIYKAGVGSTVEYELTVEVPHNIAALTTFKVTDDPTNITVDESTIVVKCGSTTLVKNTDYTVEENTANNNGFVINFVPGEIYDCAGQSLTITYDATVLTDAANTNNAPNTATLTYTDVINADGTEGGTDEDKDDEIVYNFKIDITKRLDSANGTLAAGVQFELYNAAGEVVKATKNSDGIYVVDATGSKTLETDENGKLVVSGLDKGVYTLKETKTYEGYNLLSGEIEIDLNETDVADYSFEQTIVNKKGFNLPQTGGIGTLMFIIIGGVLMAGGICLIVPNKKRAV